MSYVELQLPPRLAPVAALLKEQYVTTAELAVRWGYTVQVLRNARSRLKGMPWVELPTGGIRYRLSDVIMAELNGMQGPMILSRIEIELATIPEVTPEVATLIIDTLRRAGAT
jgi:hypothetical protein